MWLEIIKLGEFHEHGTFGCFFSINIHPPKTNMTMEQPFEDVSPIKNGDFPTVMVVSVGGTTGYAVSLFEIFKILGFLEVDLLLVTFY